MPWRAVPMGGGKGNAVKRAFLVEGISINDCLGAWCPKRASSYEESKISLINPSALNLLSNGLAFPSWSYGIGWTFANIHYLTIATALVTAVPLSMVCLFNASVATDNDTLMSVTDNAAANYFMLVVRGGDAGDPIHANTCATTAAWALTSTGYLAKSWYTAEAVYSANNARTVYINGGSKGTNTTSKTPSGIDATYVGAYDDGTGVKGFYSGIIGACAFYKIALSDSQVLAVHNEMMKL